MNKRLTPKVYAAGMLWMALAPLFLLPGVVILPGKLWIAAALPSLPLALTGAAGFAPANRRAVSLLLAILMAAAGCFAIFIVIAPLGMLLFLPCLLTMLLFMPAMARPARREWTVPQMGLGVALHIAAQFLKGFEIFQPAAATVSWFFAGYLLAFLFSANRLSLADTGAAGEARPLLLQNRRLLAGLCLLALLLTNLKAVGATIRAALSWIIAAVANAMLWISSLFQSDEAATGTEAAGNPFEGLTEATEPSLFSQIMEIVFIVVGVLIAAVALFFALKYIIRLARRVFRALMERVALYRRRISADYDDQSESLLDWGELRKAAANNLGRIKRRFLPVPWEKLTPAQRVRRVYALLLRRADRPDPARTAREMLQSGALRIPPDDAAPAASLYERARYSRHPVSPQEADTLRKRAGV